MVQDKKNEGPPITKTGFLRKHDYDHLYGGIEQDTERLIQEGHLIEIKEFYLLSKEIQAEYKKD